MSKSNETLYYLSYSCTGATFSWLLYRTITSAYAPMHTTIVSSFYLSEYQQHCTQTLKCTFHPWLEQIQLNLTHLSSNTHLDSQLHFHCNKTKKETINGHVPVSRIDDGSCSIHSNTDKYEGNQKQKGFPLKQWLTTWGLQPLRWLTGQEPEKNQKLCFSDIFIMFGPFLVNY